MAGPKLYRALTPVNHDQEPYGVGKTLRLDDAAAAALLAVKAIEPADKAEQVGDQSVDSCGRPGCDRAPGALFCERCSNNLEAVFKALEAEDLQLVVPDPQ